MNKSFLDPKTNRTFEAQRVKNGNEYAWLTPPWVESKPETWVPVINAEKHEDKKA